MILETLSTDLTYLIQQTIQNNRILLWIFIILWGIFFINALLGKRLLLLGIFPRRINGLSGIIFCPFLHANFNHLFFNTIPLIVLSNFLLINGFSYFLIITGFIILLSGLLIWAFGQTGLHVGASAVITGYWALLVSNSLVYPNFITISLGLVSIYYFAGIFYGIFPGKKGVSWDGHFFGLIAGIAASFVFPLVK